jgi:hypothetical protein
MRDLPTGPSLLALARDVLLRDLLPLLPRERQLEARLVAGAMAIAEREAAAGEGPAQRVAVALQGFYGKGELPALLRRLGGDLRAGAFEDDEERAGAARAILWRLTLAKLRLANPRFVAANGFKEVPR